MLTNKYTSEAIAAYKKAYLKNFTEDNESSFDYLLVKYITQNNLYVSIDKNNQFELGLITLPKTINVNGQNFSSCLIYGVVASDFYKGTGILKKTFPDFLNDLSVEYDFVLIQSENWKIYDGLPFTAVSNELVCLSQIEPEISQVSCVEIYDLFSEDLAATVLNIYEKEVINFEIKQNLNHDLLSISKLINLNLLSKDQIYVVPGAYAFYSPNSNQAYSVGFESIDCLIKLVKSLPAKTMVHLNASFRPLLGQSFKVIDETIKTKSLFPMRKTLANLLFNEMN